MSETRTRYIWLVDEEPTSLSYTETSDVSGGVEIGMEFKPTAHASVSQAPAGSLIDVPASGAFLAGVPCVDAYQGLSQSFGLVFDESLHLGERPIAKDSVKSGPQSLFLSDSKLFQCDRIERLVHNPIGDLVIHIGHEAFLLSAQTLQLSSSGTGAFGLEFSSQMPIPTLHISYMLGFEKFIVGEDSVIDYSCVHPKNGIWWTDAWSSLLDHDAEDETLSIEGQLCRYSFPVDILPEILGNDD